MDIIKRIKGILLIPEAEWEAIEQEPGTPGYLFAEYVVYLAAIPALAGFIGRSVIGVSVPGVGTIRAPLFSGLLGAVIEYLLIFVVVYAIAIIIDMLAPTFRAQKNFANALKLTVYSCTPAWLAGIFLLVPGLRFLTIAGLYGMYLMWLGLPRLMKAPRDSALGYIVTSAICALVMASAAIIIPEALAG